MIAAISSPLFLIGNLASLVITSRRFAVAVGGDDMFHLEMLGVLIFLQFCIFYQLCLHRWIEAEHNANVNYLTGYIYF